MNTKILLTVAAGILSLIAAAQPYSLEQCVKLATDNNRTLKSKQLELDEARQTRKEAFTSFFPTVEATGLAFRSNKDIIQANFTLPGIPPIPISLLDKGNTAAVTALQPLFAGGQIYYGNRLSKVGVEAQELMMSLSEKNIRENVEQYYWQIAALREKLKTITTLDQLLQQVHNDVSVAVKAGITAKNDLLRVELQQQEIASNRLKVQNGLAVSKMMLAQLVGVSMSSFETDSVSFAEPDKPASLYADAATAVQQRNELRLMDKNIEASKLKKKMEAGKYMPTIGIGAGYIYQDFTGSGSSFGTLFATASIPLSKWWGGSHAIRREELKVKLNENEKQNAEEQLIVQINATWYALLEAYQQIELARKSIESAKENMRLSYDYYKAGTSSLSDLLDAQSIFQQSNDKYTEAYTSYQLQRLKYLQATGR